jgi:DNA adenine methylase
MELMNLSKQQLLDRCEQLGITRCKSKTKSKLIELIQDKMNINNMVEQAQQCGSECESESKNEEYKEIEPSRIHLKPLIKWSGGKYDEIKEFQKYIPVNYETYIEPFIGGGALYFYLNPNKAVINDVHSELTDFYRCIGEGKMNEIYDFMLNNQNDEETYYRIRDNMEINSPLDNAKRFYYQRKTCFRGMLRYNKSGRFNIPYGKYKTINYSELQNRNYEYLLGRTEILNRDYEYIFNTYNDENNFMFLDPPYDSEFTDYGYCKFDRQEQIKLSELFKQTRNKCLMIIGKTDFIEELYRDYIVDEYEKKYRFKLHSGRVGNEINTKHLVIKNY